MRRRRFLASLLAIMMACTTLAGCSSNSGGGTESIAQDNKTNVEMERTEQIRKKIMRPAKKQN